MVISSYSISKDYIITVIGHFINYFIYRCYRFSLWVGRGVPLAWGEGGGGKFSHIHPVNSPAQKRF